MTFAFCARPLVVPALAAKLTNSDANTGANKHALADVAAETGNGLEVRRQAAREPHHLQNAPALALESMARLNPVEVAVDIDLEQHRRVVRRPVRLRGLDALEAELRQIQLVDECIDDPHRVVLGDEVVQWLWQPRDLVPILSFDEPGHTDSISICFETLRGRPHSRTGVFTQARPIAVLQDLADRN